MRIGFDAKRAFFNSSGLGNYSRTLLNALAAAYPEHRYLLYTPAAPPAGNFPAEPRAFESITPGGIWRLFPSVWRSGGMTRRFHRDRLDVFHGLSHELPAGIHTHRHLRKLVTMHDLIFMQYPEYYPRVDRYTYERKFRYACEAADIVIAISQSTRAQLESFFHVPQEKVQVVYQNCAPEFFTDVPGKVRERICTRLGLPPTWMLYVGALNGRKNVGILLRALTLLPPAERLPLAVVTGDKKGAARLREQARALGLERSLILLHGVSNADLPALMQASRALLYPSRIEGFGIPLLEGMASGIPVVAADAPWAREVGQQAIRYADPDDAQAWAEAIRHVVLQEALPPAEKAALITRAQQFRDLNPAQTLMHLYTHGLQA